MCAVSSINLQFSILPVLFLTRPDFKLVFLRTLMYFCNLLKLLIQPMFQFQYFFLIKVIYCFKFYNSVYKHPCHTYLLGNFSFFQNITKIYCYSSIFACDVFCLIFVISLIVILYNFNNFCHLDLHNYRYSICIKRLIVVI